MYPVTTGNGTALEPARPRYGRRIYSTQMANVYFELTAAFNRHQPTVALASGQAVVFYRLAIMSKDGDWVIRETAEACRHVLSVLAARGARYRPSAPLDVRWLGGGWSSHFEFFDAGGRRIRCDFVSRPPRVSPAAIEAVFARPRDEEPLVVDVESLIRMKRTQRAKDYAVIGVLAGLLAPDKEIELTTDPDRLLALTTEIGPPRTRPGVAAAAARGDRRAVVIALAEEVDDQQQDDRRRMERYAAAASRYLEECRSDRLCDLPLADAHARMTEAAERWLPLRPQEGDDADAQ